MQFESYSRLVNAVRERDIELNMLKMHFLKVRYSIIHRVTAVRKKKSELRSEILKSDRSYPTFMGTCILVFSISVVMTSFFAVVVLKKYRKNRAVTYKKSSLLMYGIHIRQIIS